MVFQRARSSGPCKSSKEDLPVIHKQRGFTVKLFLLLFVFGSSVWYWVSFISFGRDTSLFLATVHTVLTIWIFDKWITIRRDKL